MTLTEFLLARIAEEERKAEGAGRIAWITISDHDGNLVYTTVAAQTIEDDPDMWFVDGRELGTPVTAAVTTDTMHVSVVYDERRVRAECEAKRRIVELHDNWPVLVESPPELEQGTDFESMTIRMTRQILWLTQQEYVKRFGTEPPTAPMLCALAAVYADHPDYQEEWKL